MPPTTLDLIRAKVVRLLNEAHVREHGSADLVAVDNGRFIPGQVRWTLVPAQHRRGSVTTIPSWFESLADLGVRIIHMGVLDGRIDADIWGCDDCSCWFVLDTSYGAIDRYSFVNEDGWCQGQNCACHAIPLARPGSEAASIREMT